MGKIRKNLANLLRKTAIFSSIVVPLAFAGCKPDDTTPPEISIYSPLEKKVYDSNTIPLEWNIIEENFNSAWYSTNNGQTKTPLAQSGKGDLTLSNGSYELILFADDQEENSSISTVNFSVNKIMDITPPKITISSPIKNKVYDVNEIVFNWNIDEANPKSFWYSTDNGSKISITQSGTENKYFENGNHKIVVGAEDLSKNSSKDSVSFSVDKHTWKYLVNPFVQPNDSTLNWYGSGDVDNNNTVNSQDLIRLNEIIAGTYSNPSDTRLKDRADVNGDWVVNNQDKQLLENKLNGVIAYLPGEWNKLQTRAEREDWLRKMLAIDKTNEILWTSVFDCTKFTYQTNINFRGYNSKDILEILKFYDFDISNNCRFNLPLYELQLVAYNSSGKPIQAHDINIIFVGDNAPYWNNLLRIEPQNDSINYPIGQGSLSPFATNSKFYIRGSPITGIPPGGVASIAYITYNVENSIPIFDSVNPDINLVTQRGK